MLARAQGTMCIRDRDHDVDDADDRYTVIEESAICIIDEIISLPSAATVAVVLCVNARAPHRVCIRMHF